MARHDVPAQVGPPFITADGAVNIAISTADTTGDEAPCNTRDRRVLRTIQLMRIETTGAVTVAPVFEYPPSPIDVDVVIHLVLPDDHGGQLVMWSEQVGGRLERHRVVRVNGEQRIPFVLPTYGEIILAEEDLGVTTDGTTIVGFDITTGELLWTLGGASDGRFGQLRALAGGGFQVTTERGVEVVDRAGKRRVVVASGRQ
jgi:hypothetical protein